MYSISQKVMHNAREAAYVLKGPSGGNDNLSEGRRLTIIKIQPKAPYNLKSAVITAQEIKGHAVCMSCNMINPGPLFMPLTVLLSSFNPDC